MMVSDSPARDRRDARDAAALEEISADEARILRLKKQMREQDKMRYEEPDKPDPMIYALFVWRKVGAVNKWVLVTWIRGKVTIRRLDKLRAKMMRKRPQRIRKGEVVRAVDLRSLRRLGGAGTAPVRSLATKVAKGGRKGTHLPKGTQRGNTDKREARRSAPRLTKLRGVTGRTRNVLCQTKSRHGTRRPTALWDVHYTRGNGMPVKHSRCTKCAWDESLIPETAKNVVRVERALILSLPKEDA